MKICFDTNVLLDAVGKRPGYQEAQALIEAVAEQRIEGLIAASSITDIFYLARKMIGEAQARETVKNLLILFDIAEVNRSLCLAALRLPMRDFEDAVLAACAARAGADVIVSRDRAFLGADSPVSVKRPEDLLRQLAGIDF